MVSVSEPSSLVRIKPLSSPIPQDESLSDDFPKQLFRYNNDSLSDAAHALLEGESTTENDVVEFCLVGLSSSVTTSTSSTTLVYRERRQQVHALLQGLSSGKSRIDETDRLFAVDENERALPLAPLPPLPAFADGVVARGVPLRPPPPLLNRRIDNEEDQIDERLRREATAAIARAIARISTEHENPNHIHDLQLIRVLEPQPQQARLQNPPGAEAAGNGAPPGAAAAPRRPPDDPRIRIAYALGAALSAFLCVAIHTMPLWARVSPTAKRVTRQRGIDPFHHLVAHITHVDSHVQYCGGVRLDRSMPNTTVVAENPRWWCPKVSPTNTISTLPSKKRTQYTSGWDATCHSMWRVWIWAKSLLQRLRQMYCLPKQAGPPVFDCSDGVLHITPSSKVFRGLDLRDAEEKWRDHTLDIAWFMPCHFPHRSQCFQPDDADVLNSNRWLSSNVTGTDMPSRWIDDKQDHHHHQKRKCFRGVHDEMMSEYEIRQAIRLGAMLISEGGDHFDIHYDVERLRLYLPSVIHTIQTLLRDRYQVTDTVYPVAFRLHAVGPIDGDGVTLFHPFSSWGTSQPEPLLNVTRYMMWMYANAKYSTWLPDLRYLPFRLSKFRTGAIREQCNLMADLQVNSSFVIHTTIFLSEGSGTNYRGGVALYVDYDEAEVSRRRRHDKIRRGISIDGSRGRLVVSTGGLENRRCRLPVRHGLRTSLQIWWNTR